MAYLRKNDRKKINDEFTGMLKADGTPMSRQQIYMLRKRAKKRCATCGNKSKDYYCEKCKKARKPFLSNGKNREKAEARKAKAAAEFEKTVVRQAVIYQLPPRQQ